MIGRPVEGGWSHGMIGEGEKIEEEPLHAAEPQKQLAIPAEKLGAIVAAAQEMIRQGIDTPEKMAAVLEEKFGGKARPYSQAMWDAMGMVKPDLRGTHDFPAIYARSTEPEPAKAATPAQAIKIVTEGIQESGRAEQKEAKAQLLEALTDAKEKAPDVDPSKLLHPSEAKEQLGTVDIHVPGDGEFSVLNAKPAIDQVISKVKSMETGNRVTPAPKTPIGRGATEVESYADQLIAKHGLSGAIADQEAQLKQVEPDSPAGRMIRRTLDELRPPSQEQKKIKALELIASKRDLRPEEEKQLRELQKKEGEQANEIRAGEEPRGTQNIGKGHPGTEGTNPFPSRESFKAAFASERAANGESLESLGVTSREVAERAWAGSGYDYSSRTILYNSEALERTVNSSSDARGALKASVNEETIHAADHRTGDAFIGDDERIFQSAESLTQTLVKSNYGGGDEPSIVLGAEYIRMLTQVRAGQPVTESFYRDTSELERELAKPQSKEAEAAAERIIEALGWAKDEPLGAAIPRTAKELKRKFEPGLDILTDIKEGIQSLLLPTAQGPEHLAAAELLGSKLGAMHRRQEASRTNLNPGWYTFEKMGVHREDISLVKNPGIQFMSDISQGKIVAPELKKYADKRRTEYDKRLTLLEKADSPLQTVREHYFPGMWTRESRLAFNQAMNEAIEKGLIAEDADIESLDHSPQQDQVRERAIELLNKGKGSDKDALFYLTRRPMKGKETFRKEKVFDDILSAVRWGLVPISNNPVDLDMLKLAEMDKSIMANQFFQALKAKGQLKVITPFEKVPDGWEKVNDKYGTIYGPRPEKPAEGEPAQKYQGLQIFGYRIVPKAVADILNNFLSSSLYNNRYFGKLYTGWMGFGNMMNQSQLGIGSAFHAGFTTIEAQVSAGANIVKDVYGLLRGNRSLSDLLKTAGNFATAPVMTAVTGDQVLNAWRHPDGVIDDRIAQVVRAAELAGGGFKLETGLQTQQSAKFISDWLNGHRLRAARRSPVAFVEMLAKPIMDYLVPRQKAGVFAHLAWRVIEQNPEKSLEELTPEFRAIWNRIDARLGQVRYDRLFMNNVAKNVMQGTVRAPGWSFGTIAELGGAFKDTYKFFEEFAKTGKLPRDIPDRVAYVISLLVGVAALNALLTYLFTGTKPEDLDYWAFRSGGKDQQGNPERFMLPSYVKDLIAYTKAPVKTLIDKMHPLLSVFGSLYTNKDYWGVEISDPDVNLLHQAIQKGAYVAKAFTPFWISGAQKTIRQGGLTPKAALPLIGIMPAPRRITQTPAEALADRINQATIPGAPMDERQAERRQEKSDIVSQPPARNCAQYKRGTG